MCLAFCSLGPIFSDAADRAIGACRSNLLILLARAAGPFVSTPHGTAVRKTADRLRSYAISGSAIPRRRQVVRILGIEPSKIEAQLARRWRAGLARAEARPTFLLVEK